jgi:hypothetical protein
MSAHLSTAPRLIRAMIALAAACCLMAACTAAPVSDPIADSTTISAGPDYAAMKETIEDRIASGSLNLSTIDAVLVSVGGGTKIAHYRNGRKSSPSAPCPRKTRRNRHVAVDQ